MLTVLLIVTKACYGNLAVYLGHDNGITNFHFEIAADLLTDEEADLIAKMRPGLIQLEIGVQSTHDETIREIHRHMDLKMCTR